MTETRPFIRLRGRSIMALVLSPEPPLSGWLASLDAQIERAPNFFDGRPVIVDLGTLPRETSDVAGFMHAIVSRGIHIIGTEGAHASWTGLEAWGRPLPPGRALSAGARASNKMRSAAGENCRAAWASSAVSTGTAFTTGMPQRARTSATRVGVSYPCSWMRSGAAEATTWAMSASSGSTINATILALPRALAASVFATAGSVRTGPGRASRRTVDRWLH